MKLSRLRALVYTDFAQMKLIYPFVTVMIIFDSISMLFWSAAQGEVSSIMTSNFGIVAMFFMTNAFAFDEKNGLKAYRRSLPYTDTELVLARYITPAGTALLCIAADTVMAYLGTMLCKDGMSPEFGESLIFHIMMIVTSIMLVPALAYPAFFRLSFKKAMAVFSVVGVIGLGAATFMLMKGAMAMSSRTVYGKISVPAGLAVIAAVTAVYCISCCIAVMFSKRTDS